MEINLQKIKSVHFIGIGGIGVSAIARLMVVMGKTASGSDINHSPITDELEKLGIKIYLGQNPENITSNMDLVIHTIAVKENNPELLAVKNLGIQTVTYPEMLSVLSKDMYTIAVSGTHGKTTTTAMIAKIFIDLKLDPTVIVGSILKDYNSNLIVGKSNYFIVEACEYQRSFLNLHPNILIITNIDLDHLDYYKDLPDIQSAFRELALRIPKDGAVICNPGDERVMPVIQGLACTIVDYTTFIHDLKLNIPGNHNRQNAGASLAVSDFVHIDPALAQQSLMDFSGTWRRFDLKGKTSHGTAIYDDYAHHPKEIVSALSGMKEMYPDLHRVAFFQPHLYSRTKEHLDDFSQAFNDVDEVYILPIFAARETKDESINSEMLVEKILQTGKKVSYVKNFDEALVYIKKLGENVVVINIGAGDIYKLSEIAISL